MATDEQRGGESRPTSLHVAHAIWLFGILSYFLPAATWSPVSRYETTRAIVERGELTIDAFADSTGDRALRGGHWYSDKAPLPALVAVVPYAAYRVFDRLRGGSPKFTAVGTADLPARRVYANDSFRKGLYICSLSTAAASGAILGALVLLLMQRRSSDKTALLASAFTVLGTPILPYATSFYGHVPAAACLFGALFAQDGLEVGTLETASGRKRLRVVGACLAAAVGCEYLVALPALIAGVWVLHTARRRALLATKELAVGALGPVAVVSAYHAACFGAPWKTGYSFIARPEFAAGHASGLLGIHFPTASGLYGLLFGDVRGLFFISPVALFVVAVALPGARVFRDGTSRLALVMLGALLWLNAGYYMWWGGAAAGPRHLVPALGAIAFGVAAAWEVPRLRWIVAVAAFVSFVDCLVLTAVGLEAPEHGNILRDYAFPRLLSGMIAHLSGATNLGIEMGLSPAASLGPLLAWVLVGFRFLVRLSEGRHGDAPAPGAVSVSASLIARRS
jgi:hypothetical protein